MSGRGKKQEGRSKREEARGKKKETIPQPNAQFPRPNSQGPMLFDPIPHSDTLSDSLALPSTFEWYPSSVFCYFQIEAG
ncbi:MAG: hypothetical protein U7126_14595 [Microcoleus sp.]